MGSRLPCYCSVCILGTYEDDDGGFVSGSLQTSKTRKQHEISDAKRERRIALQSTRVETQVMVTTLGDQRHSPGSTSVVRARDTILDQRTMSHENTVGRQILAASIRRELFCRLSQLSQAHHLTMPILVLL